MEPPGNYFEQNPNPKSSWLHIANCYVDSILKSQITKVIHLSSVGAHTTEGVGMLEAHCKVEHILKGLPESIAIKFMRPVGFYYNMFGFIPAIKSHGSIIQNYGGDQKEPWVSPLDIAAVIAEEFEKPFNERTVRYIASDEISPNDVAKVLGEAIGLPNLKWISISDEQYLNGLLEAGVNPNTARGLAAMNAGRLNNLYDDYNRNKPSLGKVKMKDFAKDFATVYNQ
ncbi:NAD-dependent dehydratase [Chitinophaga sancti]|uniref:NAD-dependent dehydratase n=1 Tax=Chitinophaga sancti TaxID=1004 RepID=UPI002A74E0F1|nr:NAD-dependent dehydratase [Chitinophaga sancti]WPQ63084.1 NAD-dependent dehydratase [Chitinophaga sancti]